MTIRQRDRSLGDGVFFAPEDYIGLAPRIVILIVDSAVLAGILLLAAIVWLSIFPSFDRVFVWAAILAVWLYLVPLKRSRIRTVGYRITRAKLVTLKGHQPSLFMLTFRSLLWLIAPFNIFLDLIWCGIDDDRQTLRDRFTSMCLVRNDAQPIGQGEIYLAHFNAFGYVYRYPHVVHLRLPRRAS